MACILYLSSFFLLFHLNFFSPVLLWADFLLHVQHEHFLIEEDHICNCSCQLPDRLWTYEQTIMGHIFWNEKRSIWNIFSSNVEHHFKMCVSLCRSLDNPCCNWKKTQCYLLQLPFGRFHMMAQCFLLRSSFSFLW